MVMNFFCEMIDQRKRVKPYLTHFKSLFSFYTPENIKKLWLFDVFRGYRKRLVERNGLMPGYLLKILIITNL